MTPAEAVQVLANALAARAVRRAAESDALRGLLFDNLPEAEAAISEDTAWLVNSRLQQASADVEPDWQQVEVAARVLAGIDTPNRLG